METRWSSMFEGFVDVLPGQDVEAVARRAPGKWAVYLMTGEGGVPVQLLCVKNLRASLRRRLGAGEEGSGFGVRGSGGEGACDDRASHPPPARPWEGGEKGGASRKIDYRAVVRGVWWRRVDSAFEADWVYFEAARRVFPGTYRGMVGLRPAWWVHVDPEAEFPRWVKTTKVRWERGEGRSEMGDRRWGMGGGGVFLGPVEDKHAAGRLIERVEDVFDLCRYYNILIEAPGGSACAYKEMGKCPAPCDGSISMEEYREMVRRSVAAVVDPRGELSAAEGAMRAAAEGLRFEEAGRLKARAEQLRGLGKGAWRHVRRVEDFRYVSVQGGPGAVKGKLFLVVGGVVEEVLGLIGRSGMGDGRSEMRDGGSGGDPDHCPASPGSVPAWGKGIGGTEVVGWVLERAGELARELGRVGMDAVGAERIGMVSQHLFSAKRAAGGVLIHLDELDEGKLWEAFEKVQKGRKVDAGAEDEGEGVMKELQAM